MIVRAIKNLKETMSKVVACNLLDNAKKKES